MISGGKLLKSEPMNGIQPLYYSGGGIEVSLYLHWGGEFSCSEGGLQKKKAIWSEMGIGEGLGEDGWTP